MKQFLLLAFALSLVMMSHCSRQDDPVVAQFGKNRITLNEYKIGYLEILKQPQVLDTPDLREQFLDEMIVRRLLADEVRNLGCRQEEKLQYKVNAWHDKCLREAHFQEVIRPQIKISDNELHEVYSYITQQRHIRHLFFETEKEANLAYLRLAEGLSWDSLAARIFPDEKMASSGGDLGWVYWDQLEYDLGLTAFRLKVNEISRPVASSFGYHILKVADYKINPMINEQDFQIHRQKTSYLLEKKNGDKLASEYIRNMMSDKKITAQTDMMNLVASRFSRIFLRQPGQYDAMLEAQLTPAEVRLLEENFWDNRNRVLLSVDDAAITVGDFLYALNYVPYTAIAAGFKTALDHVIRDQVLTREAIEMKLERHYPEIRIKTRQYEDNILQTEFRRKIIADISINDQEIMDHFQADSITDEMRDMYLKEKKNRTMSTKISNLMSAQIIRKNTAVIHQYYDNL